MLSEDESSDSSPAPVGVRRDAGRTPPGWPFRTRAQYFSSFSAAGLSNVTPGLQLVRCRGGLRWSSCRCTTSSTRSSAIESASNRCRVARSSSSRLCGSVRFPVTFFFADTPLDGGCGGSLGGCPSPEVGGPSLGSGMLGPVSTILLRDADQLIDRGLSFGRRRAFRSTVLAARSLSRDMKWRGPSRRRNVTTRSSMSASSGPALSKSVLVLRFSISSNRRSSKKARWSIN